MDDRSLPPRWLSDIDLSQVNDLYWQAAVVAASALSVDECAGQIIQVEWMALRDRKCASLTMCGLDTLTAKALRTYGGKSGEEVARAIEPWAASILPEAACAPLSTLHIGGVMGGGGSAPCPNSATAWFFQNRRLQRLQRTGTSSRLPLVIATDAVHGHNNLLGATIFPHHIGLGCAAHGENLVEAIGRATALEAAATGVNLVYAPCVAVAQDPRWGRCFESYHSSGARVAALGAAELRGLLNAEVPMMAAAKHFVGDGATAPGTGVGCGLDQGDSMLSDEAIRANHLPPFRAAIRAGVVCIMASFSSLRGQPMHSNRTWLTDVLKGELNFRGFVCSDYDAVPRLAPGDLSGALALALMAGIDTILTSGGIYGGPTFAEYRAAIVKAVGAGALTDERLRDACARNMYALVTTYAPSVLRARAAHGEAPPESPEELLEAIKALPPLPDAPPLNVVGCEAHRDLARRAARETAVLLVNKNNCLPLDPSHAVVVGGRAADDLGMLCGGWTLSWQGQEGNEHLRGEASVYGTTVWGAIHRLCGSGAKLDLAGGGGPGSADETSPAAAIVVVVGETPYAEWHGDREVLEIPPSEFECITAFHQKYPQRHIVLVVITGRPLSLPEDVFAKVSSVLVAWLPGSEGGPGICDLLFAIGGARPTGKLSFAWPKPGRPGVAHCPPGALGGGVEPEDAGVLFPVGYGLTYT